jgi:hypothetical protein
MGVLEYRSDGRRVDWESRLRAQRWRFVVLMLYLLPFIAVPIGLGGYYLYQALREREPGDPATYGAWPTAVLFLTVGLVLLIGWTAALILLLRQRRLLVWQAGDGA